jgi:acetylornithine/succinyldiaminopimelate/putrescine aminotransferase
MPETNRFLSDVRYLVGAIAVPRGKPLFRWNEKDGNKEAALKEWIKQGSPNLEPLLTGCAWQPLLPDAYHAGCRNADRLSRPYSLKASVAFLQTMLGLMPADIRAVVGPCYDSRMEEYRVGLGPKRQGRDLPRHRLAFARGRRRSNRCRRRDRIRAARSRRQGRALPRPPFPDGILRRLRRPALPQRTRPNWCTPKCRSRNSKRCGQFASPALIGNDARANHGFIQPNWLARSQAAVWHPCTQMQHHAHTGSPAHLPLAPIARGKGAWLYDFDGKRYLDGISSWWTNLFGHANPRINAALREQLETLEHVMLAGFTHQPVVELSERLSALTAGTLGPRLLRLGRRLGDRDRTEDELPLLAQQRSPGEGEFLCLAGSYHGETVGALAVTDVAIFKDAYAPLVRAAMSSPRPISAWPKPANPRPTSPAAPPRRSKQHLEQHGENTAALIVEPLVQGAAGMAMYDPEYLRLARALCDRYEVHLICDEIAVGCGRTGTFFAHEQAAKDGNPIRPDLMCLSKGISGGYLPLSVVLCSDADLRRLPRRLGRPRLPALALLHRQPAGLPRRAGDARHFRGRRHCCGQPPKSGKNQPPPSPRWPTARKSAICASAA